MLKKTLRRAVLRFSIRSRQKKAHFIVEFVREHQVRTIIFGGASAGGREPNEMIVERAVSDAATVVSAFDIRHRAGSPWPFVVGDGRHMPYLDAAADLVISNAVIEHVGGAADQERFVAEHVRVSPRCIITTPNRWFPVESHTSAILRHWSPAWRAQRPEFTRLLSLREFRRLLPDNAVIHGKPWSATFTAVIVNS